MILDNKKIAKIWKQYLEDLYQEGEITGLNNNNNPDMHGATILREEFNKVPISQWKLENP